MTRGSDVAAVLRVGHRSRTPRIDISWRGNTVGHPRVGIVVPRHGRAVVLRNRLRRRLREIARRCVLPALGARDLVIRPRTAAYGAQFRDLAADLESWLHSLPG